MAIAHVRRSNGDTPHSISSGVTSLPSSRRWPDIFHGAPERFCLSFVGYARAEDNHFAKSRYAEGEML